MAIFALTDCYVGVGTAWAGGAAPGGTTTPAGTITGAVNISAMTTNVEVSFESDELDATTFAAGGWRQKVTGIATGNISLTINQDFAASQGNALFGLGGTVGFAPGQSTPYYIDIRPTSAARSGTNPSFVAAWVSTSYQPVTGGVGELAVITLQLPMTGRPGQLTS
jgi:hypothetical protein